MAEPSRSRTETRVLARMAGHGESYQTARRAAGGRAGPRTDAGWRLRGGAHPDSASVANVLAHLAGDPDWPPLTEPMLLGIGGGLGAGYLLWEFAGQPPNVILGFRYRWDQADWAERTLARLGVDYQVHTTGSGSRAAAALTEALAAGATPIVRPDRQLVRYGHLPPELAADPRARPVYANGRRAPVVVYGTSGDRVRIDDRNLAPLTVDHQTLALARARLSSSKHYQLVVRSADPPSDLAGLVRTGIADCVAHLSARSAAAALPAWQKWAKLLADQRNPKGWPQVFPGGAGLVRALLAVWEGIEPVGLTGGNLREMYADFLAEAAPVLGRAAGPATEAADRFRAAAARWHELAEAALPGDVPEYARLRELAAAIAAGVAAGDAGTDARSGAAVELWERLADHDRRPPATPDLGAVSGRAMAVYEAERDAVAALSRVAAGR